MENINIFALGGQDENGKNCYVFEIDNSIFLVNAGVKIPINSQNGVDTLIPDFSYLEKNKTKIKGIFITDVKNESFSALPWLVMKIPGIKIYTSSFNKVLIHERLNKYNISEHNYKIIVINQKTKFGNLIIDPINLSGSMPGNLGYNFITPHGSYLFLFNFALGDLGIYGKTSLESLKETVKDKELIALIADAGKSNVAGESISKFNQSKQLVEAFETTNGDQRIIIGAYDEEMAVLERVLELASKHDRPVVAYGKTYAQLLYLISKINSNLKLPNIVDYKNINKHPNAVVLVTGSIDRLYLRFLRITDGKDVYLKLSNKDTIVMLAPPVNGLESLAALTLDEIAKIAPKLYDIMENEYFRARPTRQDLLNLVLALKPHHFIPTQGLYRYLVDSANYISNDKLAKKTTSPIILLNGKIAHFVDGKLFSLNGKVKEVGDTIIDGFGVGDISSEVIAEREALGREGVIVINTLYSPKTKKLLGQLHINYVGVIDPSEQMAIDTLIKEVILDILENKEFTTMRELNERLRKSIRKKIFKLTDKDPMIALTLTTI
ncbi:ribonuclease J [Mycoplasmopsis gallopavonis]|uniref:Hydrolase n=1 Tax=Mycoplasmopsis gallopavonis TaxID=76629 RepID=A0A449AZ21_9BACT|nr:ribonuclease J [Mycoplasmopsis gallopavonis]RIV16576.1 ribonuclease J [Mycoplasmopsis gallopavonis]VEU72706.1 hydrolase [Mycoplasmopsis gallopavonis]